MTKQELLDKEASAIRAMDAYAMMVCDKLVAKLNSHKVMGEYKRLVNESEFKLHYNSAIQDGYTLDCATIHRRLAKAMTEIRYFNSTGYRLSDGRDGRSDYLIDVARVLGYREVTRRIPTRFQIEDMFEE